jgi:hypothetical protein
MAASPGRSTEPKAVASVVTTSGSKNITFPSGKIVASDIGRPITGTGIAAGSKLATVTSATAGTVDTNATASGTVTATLGSDRSTATGYGFFGWSPETDAEAALYPQPTDGAGAPSILTDSTTRVVQRYR